LRPLYLSTSKSGQTFGLSAFSRAYATRKESLCAALADTIKWHTKAADKKAAGIIKKAQAMLEQLVDRAPKQLSLFGAG
jgi:hypothetical protein